MSPRRSTSRRRGSAARTADSIPASEPAGGADSTVAAPQPSDNSNGKVLVRMYGQGLGDCFLLTFPRTSRPGAPNRPVYVVVDCGVIGGTPDGPARMKQIVDDIKQTTLDPAILDATGQPMGHVDVLAITHEHWDHVSGFVQAEDEWKQIQVDALWTAWTELKDDDGLPEVLRNIIKKQQKALAEIADRAVRFGLSEQHEVVLDLMAFQSDAASDGVAFGQARGTADAFDIAKGLARSHVCCEPGQVRQVPGTDSVAYVLGPPRSDARLRQMDPSRKDPETFHDEEGQKKPPAGDGGTSFWAQPERLEFAPPDPTFSLSTMAQGRSTFNAFALPLVNSAYAFGADSVGENANGALTAAEADAYDLLFPFAPALRVPLPVAEAETASSAARGAPDAYPALASYFAEINAWRRVDFDWMTGAEAFALQADSLTNNTCLVLAFELPPPAGGSERNVLLFVGDAQVGNWLSWDEIKTWTRVGDARPSQSEPDIPDLMKRTTFYKVGHHGSHNSTLKARGVERMRKDQKLTAFVPVSPVVARELKDWCQMPLDVLLDALAERTGGRVVLANGNVWPPVSADKLDETRKHVGLTVSPDTLPAKVRKKDGETIEGPVPLWVQIAIDY